MDTWLRAIGRFVDNATRLLEPLGVEATNFEEMLGGVFDETLGDIERTIEGIAGLDIGYGDYVWALENQIANPTEKTTRKVRDEFNNMKVDVRESLMELAGTQRAMAGKMQESTDEWKKNTKQAYEEVAGTLRANHGKMQESTGATVGGLKKQELAYNEWKGAVIPQINEVSGTLRANHGKIQEAHGELKAMHSWLSSNKFKVDFEWPEKPDWLDDYIPKSPPPLAQGVRMISDEFSHLASVMNTVRGTTPGLGAVATSGGGSTVVNINAPLMENVMVPNMQVGRALSLQIARDIGQVAAGKRHPA
jgi:hypothetical protein